MTAWSKSTAADGSRSEGSSRHPRFPPFPPPSTTFAPLLRLAPTPPRAYPQNCPVNQLVIPKKSAPKSRLPQRNPNVFGPILHLSRVNTGIRIHNTICCALYLTHPIRGGTFTTATPQFEASDISLAHQFLRPRTLPELPHSGSLASARSTFSLNLRAIDPEHFSNEIHLIEGATPPMATIPNQTGIDAGSHSTHPAHSTSRAPDSPSRATSPAPASPPTTRSSGSSATPSFRTTRARPSSSSATSKSPPTGP